MRVRNRLSMVPVIAMFIAACGTEAGGEALPEPPITTTTPTTGSVKQPVIHATQGSSTTHRVDSITTSDPGQEPAPRRYAGARSMPAFATPEGDYWIASIVIQEAGESPIVCVGVVAASLPPRCGGLVLVGFDWTGIDHDVRGDVQFSIGTYLEGTIEGHTFVVSFVRDATEYDQSPHDRRDLSSPCPPPEGGWLINDPTLTTDEAFAGALEYANTIEDLSASWVTQPPVEAPDPLDLILNVGVVDNLDLHEAELRSRWGGPLCVFQRPGLAADLRAIQDEISSEDGALGVTIVAVDEIDRVVEVGVIVADAGTLAYFAARFDVDVVRVSGHFQPLNRP